MSKVIPNNDLDQLVHAVAVPVNGINNNRAVQALPLYPFTELNEFQISKLKEQGFTEGIAKSLETCKKAFALRIWIVDNSGSMQRKDGYKLVAGGGNVGDDNQLQAQNCTRWEEIQDCVNYHIQLAKSIHAPTTFRLLNSPDFRIPPKAFNIAHGESVAGDDTDVQEGLRIMSEAQPQGATPLTQHILDIYDQIKACEPELRASGRRVAVIIATDGLPTECEVHRPGFDQYNSNFGSQSNMNVNSSIAVRKRLANAKEAFAKSLRMLEGLPVWIMIRLCTSEEYIVEYYNELDAKLELSIEVLDDFISEGNEIYRKNCWLTYGLPLHRIREIGFHNRLVDLLDERLLTIDECGDLMRLLFGERKCKELPDPSVEWKKFVKFVDKMQKTEKKQWHPLKRKFKYWIHIADLKFMYPQPCCIIS